VVDRSLEKQAADRGITICFADLDGVDGLWLPDERTILVDSRLGDRRAAEVLDHEFTHVDIDDGHAALDGAVRRRVGRTRLVVAASVAACLMLLAGIWLQFTSHSSSNPRQGRMTVADHTTAPPQTVPPRRPTGPPAVPATKVVTQVGEVRTQTVTVPAPTATIPRTSAGMATATVPPVAPTVSVGRPTTPTPTTSAAPPPTTTQAPPATATPTPSPSASPTVPGGASTELPIVE
jgi:hypothetical protein